MSKPKSDLRINVVKLPLSHILLPQHLPRLQNLIFRTHTIVTRTYQFMMLYCSHLYTQHQTFPVLDVQFVKDVFKILTIKSDKRGTPSRTTQLQTLRNFYTHHCHDDPVLLEGLAYILPYEAIDIVTNIKNNIEQHFCQHLFRLVNLTFYEEKKIIRNFPEDQRKDLYKAFNKRMFKIKEDLILFRPFESEPQYHDWIRTLKAGLFPDITTFKNSIPYMLKAEPLSFLSSMFFLHQQFQNLQSQRLKDKQKNIRLFHVLPLRTTLIPCHITVDTASVINNFLGPGHSKYLISKLTQDQRWSFWNQVFDLTKPMFRKKNHQFHMMIRTDGIACSILFHQEKSAQPLQKDIKLEKSTKKKKSVDNTDTLYIEKIPITNTIKQKQVVCIDPNLSDLIYAGQYQDNKLKTFRYTQNQRRKELRIKRYRYIRKTINTKTFIEEKSILEWEMPLTLHNSKTTNTEEFKFYCQTKNQVAQKLENHYQKPIFRKLQLNGYINTQKSESNMLNNFKEHFGPPQSTLVLMGDFDKQEGFRGVEPTICKRFRWLFKKSGYEIYLINEFRTSCRCNSCHEEMEHFLMRPSKKPKKLGEEELCYGLYRCRSEKHQRPIIHNRDKNAIKNMLFIAKEVMEKGQRPEPFNR